MKFRKNILPQRPIDIFFFLVIAILLPLGFLFEMYAVLPLVHEPGSFRYNFTLIVGLFIFLNIMFNLAACMLVDTSVDFKRTAATAEERANWRHCSICDCLVPPKSWHCTFCGTCILKRDHHCLFTGCCIGHNNERYFMCLLFYMVLGSVYAFIYNVIYVIQYNIVNIIRRCLITIFPFNSFDTFKEYAQIMFLSLDMVMMFFACFFFIHYFGNVFRGGVKVEKKTDHKYTKNEIYCKLRSILGERMHLAWIFPLIESKLSNDGYTLKDLN